MSILLPFSELLPELGMPCFLAACKLYVLGSPVEAGQLEIFHFIYEVTKTTSTLLNVFEQFLSLKLGPEGALFLHIFLFYNVESTCSLK